MKVFLTGASGVLGRELLRQFRAHGHAVVGAVRSEKSEHTVRALGGEPKRVDLFDAEALARAAEGCEVVIHAATSIPLKTKTSPRDWEENDRLRREGTQALTHAAARIGARAYFQQSITWVARPPDGSAFDEDSAICTDWITQSAYEGEQMARAAGAHDGFTVGVLRCGGFYGPKAGHTRKLADALRKRQMPIVGAGDAVWSLIHTEDAAGAFVAAAEHPRAGVWHIVDDRRVTVREFLEEFARQLSAPVPRRVPVWLARLVAGRDAVRYLTTPMETSNARFRRDFAWQPRYPSIREGLAQVAAVLRAKTNG